MITLDTHGCTLWKKITSNYQICSLQRLVENQYQLPLKTLRTDKDGKYINHNFQNLLSTSGIHYQYTCKYISEQNDVDEHKDHHIIDIVWTMLHDVHLLHSLWTNVHHRSLPH